MNNELSVIESQGGIVSMAIDSLTTLAVEIDALNEQANIYANQALIYAAKCGQKLLLAKAQCNHGDFKTWLDENCKISIRHSQNYMKLAADMPELLSSNTQSIAYLPSITQAIALLNAPEEIRETVTAKIEAGEDVTIKEIQRLKKEAADLLAEKEAIQNDLIAKTQSLESAEAKAQLILENQQAIADAKRERDNAQGELERLKKEQATAIADGVTLELNKLDTEIKQKLYKIEMYERDLDDLKKVKLELDVEVGALAVHKSAIKQIKDDLSSLALQFSDAFDTGTIPSEVFTDWQAIRTAIKKLDVQMDGFIDDCSVIDVAVLEVQS